MTGPINPRCLSGSPKFIGSEGHLLPCCFLNPFQAREGLIEWAKKNGCDALHDLNLKLNTSEEIYNSPTWKKLLEGFETGNVPTMCYATCSTGTWTSTTNQPEWRKDG